MTDHLVRTSGEHVRVSTGDRVVVRLEELGSAGYQWSITRVPGALTVVGEQVLPPDSRAPGAAGAHEFVLDATGTGSGQVVLELRRPWETGAPERTVLVDVTVV
jgi:predicted secreted protein